MPTQKELMNQASEQYGTGGGGNFFRFDGNGKYKIRILTPCFPLATHFLGKGIKPAICYGADKGCPFHGEKAPKDDEGNEKKPSVKFCGYVIDRNDGQVKLGELPYSVISRVTDLQEDEDWTFEDFPMPYDIKIDFNKEEAPANMYKTTPVPEKVPLTEDEQKALDEAITKMTPEQYVEKRKEKQLSNDNFDGVHDKVVNEKSGYDYPTGAETEADIETPF